ncbi:MAG TPA: PhoH family protein [Rhodospirillaceae bacterium]|nr:PhoH family protein [Rhodospirillaceae bacterium]
MGEDPPVIREFADNALLPMLYGPHNGHLDRIEKSLGVSLTARGNALTIRGAQARMAEACLVGLYQRLEKGLVVDFAEIDAMLRLVAADATDAPVIMTRKRHIQARSLVQADYIRAMEHHEMVLGLGPAGTGKTYLAVAKAVSMMVAGLVDRIILSRPAVEAGERLGFLPGDLRDKVDPYLRPLYDALHDMLPGDQVAKKMAAGDIEVAPLAFMRGRTLANAFVILDEAQNTTPVQMKMFLTRMGEHSRMVVTGDLSQVDLPPGSRSGLADALEVLGDIPEIKVVRFTDRDVVRHGLVSRIVRAYESRDRLRREQS